jgi:hypothetical protein
VQRYTNFIASTTATNSTLTVLSNASCVVYIAGTLGAATIYSDNGVTPLANPFLSSATGRIDFYAANGRYDVVVSKTGYLTVTISDIELDDLLASSGSNSVGYLPAGTGAVASTVQTKLRESVSVKDFGAVGDGVADDTAAINLAIVAGTNVFFPAGTYLINTSILVTSKNNVSLQGAGMNVSIIKCAAATTFSVPPLDVGTSTNVSVNGFTFDSNANASVTASLAMVRFVSCSDITFSENRINHAYVGIGVDSCTRFRIERNFIRKSAISTTLNYNINVSSTLSVSNQGEVNDNFCTNSGSGFVGNNINISRNQFTGNSYGAGIATFAVGAAGTTIGQFYGKYVISDNLCQLGTQRDADGFMVAGMEIAGPYSRIENNTVASNAGAGIRLFAYQSICSGNNVFGNGTGLDGTFYQAGIVPYDATTITGYNASYSTITGNQCFDNGGGTQLYGYYDQQTTLLGMVVEGNNFNNNVTGPFVVQSSRYSNTYDFNTAVAYTPTMISTTGTITLVGARTGQYFLRGRIVYFQAQGTITTNGTGATSIQIGLPFAAITSASSRWVISGRGDAISGSALTGVIASGGTTVVMTTYNALYPGADGERIAVEGWYQI